MGFGNLRNLQKDDGVEPVVDRPSGDASTAAPTVSQATPAGADDLSQFDAAPPPPEDGGGTPAAPSAAPADDVNARLAAAGATTLDPEAIRAGAESQDQAHPATADASPVDASAEAAPAPEEVAPNIEDVVGPDGQVDLTKLDFIGPSHRALTEMLKGIVDEPEAMAIANAYTSHLRTDLLPRIAKLDLDKAAREKMLKRATSEAAGYASGGGIITSLLNKVWDPVRHHANQSDAIGRKRRKIIADADGTAEMFRQRLVSARVRQAKHGILEMTAGAAALRRAVNQYNEAVLASDPAKPLRAQLEAMSQAQGRPMHEIIQDVIKGNAPADALEALAAIQDEVRTDPAVKEAAARIKAEEQAFADISAKALRQAESALKMRAETMDPGVYKEQTQAGLQMMLDEMPDTLVPEDEETQKRLKERLAETMEKFRAAIDAMLNRLSAALGLAPAA